MADQLSIFPNYMAPTRRDALTFRFRTKPHDIITILAAAVGAHATVCRGCSCPDAHSGSLWLCSIFFRSRRFSGRGPALVLRTVRNPLRTWIILSQ